MVVSSASAYTMQQYMAQQEEARVVAAITKLVVACLVLVACAVGLAVFFCCRSRSHRGRVLGAGSGQVTTTYSPPAPSAPGVVTAAPSHCMTQQYAAPVPGHYPETLLTHQPHSYQPLMPQPGRQPLTGQPLTNRSYDLPPSYDQCL